MSQFARSCDDPEHWEEALAEHMAAVAARASRCQHGKDHWVDCDICLAEALAEWDQDR